MRLRRPVADRLWCVGFAFTDRLCTPTGRVSACVLLQLPAMLNCSLSRTWGEQRRFDEAQILRVFL